ncbi:hypothetical protein K3495_g1059 [Podosphaera aphanis]|nr:hypothetical protein K3495_g1059 [Podosphaera aphanis]
MKVELYHTYHTPYIDIELSDEIIGFINELVATRTPAGIYQSPKDSKIPGAQSTVQHQVVSATRLLEELGDKYSHEVFTTANLRALATYIHASISNLAQNTKEIAIDATFGTNNAGMDLFALLAEFDGTGTPLAYLFVQKLAPTEAGAMTQVLVRFMEKIRFLGLDPSFVGCDKDKSEINAIQELVLRPEFQASFSNLSEDNGEVSAFEFDSDETETVEDSENGYLIAEDDDDESEAINFANIKAMMLEAIDICEQQNALGNTKFVRHFCMKNASNQTLVEEIRHINNQHTMPKTWGPYKHPSSMYHIPVAK